MSANADGLQAGWPRLVLASASATRRALLDSAALRHEARAAEVDEPAIKRAARAAGLDGAAAALRLADAKAAAIAAADPEALVIGADQLLVCGEDWFDKPPDLPTARVQLRRLAGRTHTLMTAVSCRQAGRVVWEHVATPRLAVRDFSDAFLDAYLAVEGLRVTQSVGAYRLEGPGIHLFDWIEGEHSAILGLPLSPLLGFLRGHGVLLA